MSVCCFLSPEAEPKGHPLTLFTCRVMTREKRYVKLRIRKCRLVQNNKLASSYAHAVERSTDLSNLFQSCLELQSHKCPNHHTIDSAFVVHLSLNVTARDKSHPSFCVLTTVVWRALIFFLYRLEKPIGCKVSQDPKESQMQIQSARSGWGTWMNFSTEGPDTGFADVLAENHSCLMLRESLFQQIDIAWPIVSKCINHYYQTNRTEYFKISVSE